MASLKRRGQNSFAVFYYYTNEAEEDIKHWESYKDELSAMQRKSFIDYLQKNGNVDAIRDAAMRYKQEREVIAPAKSSDGRAASRTTAEMKKLTIGELFDMWLPIYVQKNRLKPNTYDNHTRVMANHIMPYFEKQPVATITALGIDQFIEHLNRKKCQGSKSYNKKIDDVPTLSSSSVKKVYDCLYLLLKAAKAWGVMDEIPETAAPGVKYAKRMYWTHEKIKYALDHIRDNRLLHLAVHIAFICSLRLGEIMGLPIDAINFEEGSLTIRQTLQRVSNEALRKTPKDEILFEFPKIVLSSKSTVILTKPKTEESERVVYFNPHLARELRERLAQIERDRKYMGYSNGDYSNYGLLFAHPNGNPIEPHLLERWLKAWQVANDIEPRIDMQGMRKSSSMYKLRVNNFNYQEVQGDTGHTTPTVLMKHYNEVII